MIAPPKQWSRAFARFASRCPPGPPRTSIGAHIPTWFVPTTVTPTWFIPSTPVVPPVCWIGRGLNIGFNIGFFGRIGSYGWSVWIVKRVSIVLLEYDIESRSKTNSRQCRLQRGSVHCNIQVRYYLEYTHEVLSQTIKINLRQGRSHCRSQGRSNCRSQGWSH